MTCARLPAGAQSPAPASSSPAASPRKPDARSGRSRARPSLLLPVLALLLAAFSLFAAAPAEAQVTPVMGFDGSSNLHLEDGRAETITVKLNAALAVATTVSISAHPSRPSSNRAEEGPGKDFTLSTKTLSFPAGTTEKTFTVTARADQTTEGSEDAYLVLTAPANAPYTVGDDLDNNIYEEFEIQILDTSVQPGLLVEVDEKVREGASSLVVVTLSDAAPAGGTAVTLTIGTGSTATAADYTLTPRTLTVSQGQYWAQATFTARHDDADDDAETVVIQAATAAHSASETVTIVDQDVSAPMSAPSGVTVTPGPGTLTVAWDAVPAAQAAAYPDYRVFADSSRFRSPIPLHSDH